MITFADTSSRDFRRPRREPPLWKIADFWLSRGTFEMRAAEPWCFACRITATPDCALELDRQPTLKQRWEFAARFLQKAHLVDRCDGGLDAAQNIVPLCHWCHRDMPEFRAGTGPWAISWVQGGGRWEKLPGYLQRPTRSFTAGGMSWPDYVWRCAGMADLDEAEAEACAKAIDFTGRAVWR